MKKIIKSIIIPVLTLVMVLNLAGCGNASEVQSADPINIAFVVGIADDETKFNDGIAELAALPAKPGTDYAFISAEGNPSTIGEAGTIPDLSDRNYTDVMMDRVQAGIQADLTARLAAYTPSSAEIDIAAATELAVRTLNANAVDGRRNMLVYYCSGKSTAGLINMLETPVYKLDVETSVAMVSQKMNLNMSGIDVVWYCCGDFGVNQPKLSANEKAQLKAFYEQLFHNLGAESVVFKDDLPSTECYHFAATPVSCMAVEGTESQLKDFVVQEPEVLAEPVVLTEQVTFIEDKAEYLYPEEAESVLKPIADYLINNEVTILLCGTTAGDTNSDYTMTLSHARAEAVKQTLVELGVDPDSILAVGLGSSDPWHIYGAGYDGAAASSNRKVVLLDAASQTAQEILAGLNS